VGQFWRNATQNGFTFLYSGYNADKRLVHRDGVRLLVKLQKGVLLKRHPISERILTAPFKGNIQNVTVIQCYAPTEGTQIVKKLALYSKLSMSCYGQ
jgi:hypothetical protein